MHCIQCYHEPDKDREVIVLCANPYAEILAAAKEQGKERVTDAQLH